MAVAAPIFRAVFEPVDETRELFDGFLVGKFALFGAGQFRVAQNARLTVAAGPGYQRRWTGCKKVHPIKRAVLLVKADHAALYLVFAHVPAIQVKIKRGLQFTGVRAATGKFALPPAWQELLVHREQVPPPAQDAFRIGFQVRAARDQVEVWHVGTMSVEQQDFLEAVVSQRFRDVEDMVDEVIIVIVYGAGKIHHVARVAVANGGKHQHLVRNQSAGATRNLGRADDIDIERQMGTMLFDRATRQDADFAQIHGVIDLRPGKLFVTIFGSGARSTRWFRPFHVQPVNCDNTSWQCRISPPTSVVRRDAKHSDRDDRTRLNPLIPCHNTSRAPPVYFNRASGSSFNPRPGSVGIVSSPSASKCQPPSAISSMNGEPVRYSTRSVSGKAEASCKSAASPTAVFHPCGMNRTPFSCAIQAMRRSSLMPPTLVTSGCTISNAPACSQG